MKLTEAQAEILGEIICAGFGDGSDFSAWDVFPNHNTGDNASRQAIYWLGVRKLLEHVSFGGSDRYRLTPEALAAYNDWQAAQDLKR